MGGGEAGLLTGKDWILLMGRDSLQETEKSLRPRIAFLLSLGWAEPRARQAFSWLRLNTAPPVQLETTSLVPRSPAGTFPIRRKFLPCKVLRRPVSPFLSGPKVPLGWLKGSYIHHHQHADFLRSSTGTLSGRSTPIHSPKHEPTPPPQPPLLKSTSLSTPR